MSFFKNTNDDNISDNETSSSESADSDDEINENNENDFTQNIDQDDIFTQKIETESMITVFGNKNGSKTNTYIVGLNVTDEIRKKYLKALRVQYACGGTIKTILYNDENQIAINLNGDQIQNVKAFLLKEKVQQPINIKSIE
jgi:translation initiation factor 1 (eIF-1/SUI1)